MDLVELTTKFCACRPKASLIALVSFTSPGGGRAVRVQVLHLIGVEAGIAQGTQHRAAGPSTFGAVM